MELKGENMKYIILIIGLVNFLVAEHPTEHPSEHPTTVKSPKLTISQLAESIEKYIQQDVELKGGFFVFDVKNDEVLNLTLSKIHKERLSNIGNDTYFACADFKASNGKVYDLDVFMMGKSQDDLVVTEINVHKESGIARYGWQNQSGIWVKIY